MSAFQKASFSLVGEGKLLFENLALREVTIDEATFPEGTKEVHFRSTMPINVILKLGLASNNINYVIHANTRGKITHLFADDLVHINRIYHLEEGAQIDFATPDFSRANRNIFMQIELLGPDARTNWFLSGLVDKQHAKDYNISFLHKAPRTFADMQNYGVIIDDSRLTFSGTSAIFENMKRAETHQTAKIIIFDEKAVAKADPILVIHYNDVAASHAATVGKVNADHMFYMQARGISEQNAKRLITKGYLEPVIKFIDDEELAQALTRELEEAL